MKRKGTEYRAPHEEAQPPTTAALLLQDRPREEWEWSAGPAGSVL